MDINTPGEYMHHENDGEKKIRKRYSFNFNTEIPSRV
jgi:hypothetical protein